MFLAVSSRCRKHGLFPLGGGGLPRRPCMGCRHGVIRMAPDTE